MDTFSREQKFAFAKYLSGESVFITGAGGTGKTHLIREIYKNSVSRGRNIQCCSTTGCGAILLGLKAKTIHSFAGIGIASGTKEQIYARLTSNKVWYYANVKKWKTLQTLIIDEVSMMSCKLFELLEYLARRFRGVDWPFGGLQVLFFGDFYQLPPIANKRASSDKSVEVDESIDTGQFCFKSPMWQEVFAPQNHVELSVVFRQKDEEFISLLSQIRTGVLKRKTIKILEDLCDKDDSDYYSGGSANVSSDSNSGASDDGEEETPQKAEKARVKRPDKLVITQDVLDELRVRPPILFPTKQQVEQINRMEMLRLVTPEVLYRYEMVNPYLDPVYCQMTMEKNRYNKSFKMPTAEQIVQEEQYLLNNTLIEPLLNLKLGAQVMCISNVAIDMGIANGSLGVVIAMPEGRHPLVRFYNGLVLSMTPVLWESDKFEGVGIKQVPLILAYGITIHKAQGATMDMVKVDIGSNIFECGQTYVALSRVKTLDGLYLKSFEPSKIKVNRSVRDFYAGLTRMSDEDMDKFISRYSHMFETKKVVQSYYDEEEEEEYRKNTQAPAPAQVQTQAQTQAPEQEQNPFNKLAEGLKTIKLSE